MICKKCGLEKEILCKQQCKTCYSIGRWRAYQEELKKIPGKYEEHRLHRKKLEQKRRGLDVDVIPKIAKSGSGVITQQGYRRLTKRNHPNSTKSGNVLEHVFVMSSFLGRPLVKGETVHHKNGDRLDNRIENLELWSTNHGPGQRVADKIKWCREFLKQYEKEFDKL